MIYILVYDETHSERFYVRSCAELFQQLLGGEIYTVDIPKDTPT